MFFFSDSTKPTTASALFDLVFFKELFFVCTKKPRNVFFRNWVFHGLFIFEHFFYRATLNVGRMEARKVFFFLRRRERDSFFGIFGHMLKRSICLNGERSSHKLNDLLSAGINLFFLKLPGCVVLHMVYLRDPKQFWWRLNGGDEGGIWLNGIRRMASARVSSSALDAPNCVTHVPDD